MDPSVDRHLKKLGFITAEKAFDQATNQIFLRKEGRIKPYKTKWFRFNKQLGGGIQPSTIYTVGGRPGVGKSAFVTRLLLDICERNNVSRTLFTYWTWEMPGYQQILRGISSHTARTVQELMSAEVPLSDDLYAHILDTREHWKNYPMYFMSYARNADYIYAAMKDLQGLDPGLHIVNIFDHTRLALKSKGVYSEEEKISRLYLAAQQLSVNYGMTNIFLSQLNRNIEDAHRKKNPVPMLSDFFGADSVGQFSNVAIMLQRPEIYALNTYLGENSRNLLAVHIEKNRDGEAGGYIAFEHDLAVNFMYERYPLDNFPTYQL